MIPLAKPYLTADEKNKVIEVLESGRLSMGPFLAEFEQKFAAMVGVRHAIGVNSGTSGLHLCIKALGITEGDEVITTPFSFIASANCILYEKATPIFVDVDENTFNINPDLIESAITDKTKAILVVHVFGQSCDMYRIMEIAKKHNLRVIEDACESIHATHHGKMVGTFGDVGVFAFYPNKQMTTGEGGMIITNDEKIAKYCRSASNQGRSDNLQWLTHDIIGYNYRLDEMSAALGLAQVEKINVIISRRKELAEKYHKELSQVPGIKTPQIKSDNGHTWFVYPIRVSEKIRTKVIDLLEKKGVQSKAYFFPCIHLQPAYKAIFNFKEGSFPIAEKLSKETFVVPFYHTLKDEEIRIIRDALQESLEELK